MVVGAEDDEITKRTEKRKVIQPRKRPQSDDDKVIYERVKRGLGETSDLICQKNGIYPHAAIRSNIMFACFKKEKMNEKRIQ